MTHQSASDGKLSATRRRRIFEDAFMRAHGPLPPAFGCPIGWQPSALTPVFYGVRDYGADDGAPLNLRVFFPSLDGAVFSAPILAGCGRYPVVLFAHGHCEGDVNHYQKWFQLPAQLGRSGYVVVVPQLPAISTHPSTADHPALEAMADALAWIRGGWEHRDVLLPAASTGIVGHSFGALLSARFAGTAGLAAFASLSGVWQDWPSGPLPIEGLNEPNLFIWGGSLDFFTALSDELWSALTIPRHRAVFAEGEHWDYLPPGQTPCSQSRGPCRHLAAAAADLVTMFFAKYLPPELVPQQPDQVPDSLVPPPLVLTSEQELYAGGHLIGMKMIEGASGCGVSLDWWTPNDRIVPHVRFLPRLSADRDVRNADLVPRFTGPNMGVSWVFSQSPLAGSRVSVGSTVTMRLRTGTID